MFTPTIGEIQTAITTKNRQQATEMLQTLIQQKPSADAWYLAATLTSERDKKIHYLRTALLLNSKHRKSLDYLRQLGEDTGSYQALITHNFLHILQEQANKSPLLRHFPSIVQKIIGAVLGIMLLVFVGMFISTLLSMRGPALSADGPTRPTVSFISQSQVMNYFNASDLDIMIVKQTRDDDIGKDVIQMDIRDVGNRSRKVEVFVYDNVQSILNDQKTLAVFDQAANVLSYANVILVYPLDMSETSITQLGDIYDTMQS